VDGEVLSVRGSGRLAVELETGGYQLAWHDARNVKIQDLTPNTWLVETLCRETTLAVGWIAQELHAGVLQTLWKALAKRKKNGAETRD